MIKPMSTLGSLASFKSLGSVHKVEQVVQMSTAQDRDGASKPQCLSSYL